MDIKKIVITGGPCAGKSSAMGRIHEEFTQKGYTVLLVPETATEFITGGVTPWTCGTNLDYQKCQLHLQMVKEELFEQAARTMNAEKILIVCDRGMLDNKVYMNDSEFEQALEYIGKNEKDLRDDYDAIFHLVTAAKVKGNCYTTENNTARIETVEKAAMMDDMFIAAWTGHPQLKIIGGTLDFEEKMKQLLDEIDAFLNLK